MKKFAHSNLHHYRNAPIEKGRPRKLGYSLGFARKKRVFKDCCRFPSLMNFKRVTILTLSRDNAETIGVGWHCFNFRMSLSSLQKRKYLCNKRHFLSCALKLKLPDFCILVRIDSMAKQLKLIKNQNSS